MLHEETLVIRADIDDRLAFHGKETAIDGLHAFFGDWLHPRIHRAERLRLSLARDETLEDDVPDPAPLTLRVQCDDLFWLPPNATPIRVTFAVTKFIGAKHTWIEGVPPYIAEVVPWFLEAPSGNHGVILKLHCGEVKPSIVIMLRRHNNELYLNVRPDAEKT